jgi:hypothetical protein
MIVGEEGFERRGGELALDIVEQDRRLRCPKRGQQPFAQLFLVPALGDHGHLAAGQFGDAGGGPFEYSAVQGTRTVLMLWIPATFGFKGLSAHS